jgi:hypothetical protein
MTGSGVILASAGKSECSLVVLCVEIATNQDQSIGFIVHDALDC